MSSFKHVIVIVQENRTPDNLFQGLCRPPFGTSESCSTTPNATQYNIQTSNWLDKHSPTGVTQPLPVPLGNTYDLGHSHGAFNSQCDANPPGACRMDGAGDVACSGTCPSQPQFRFVENLVRRRDSGPVPDACDPIWVGKLYVPDQSRSKFSRPSVYLRRYISSHCSR